MAEETLSYLLRAGTHANHKTAESCSIMKEIVMKSVTKEKYTEYLIALYHMYVALEAALDKHKDNAVLKEVYFPKELARTASIEKDLEFFVGKGWKEDPRIKSARPETTEYVKRVNQVSEEKPELLLSHSYVRYLGDVNGGQILAKMLEAAFSISDGKGLAFYAFPNVANVRALSKQFKEGMDKVIDKALQDKLVEEANRSYILQIDIFKALD